MPFDTIIGQERPKRFLQAALRSERLAHALLFHGEERIGKLLTARVVAQAVNCEATPPPDPPDPRRARPARPQTATGGPPGAAVPAGTNGQGETGPTPRIGRPL